MPVSGDVQRTEPEACGSTSRSSSPGRARGAPWTPFAFARRCELLEARQLGSSSGDDELPAHGVRDPVLVGEASRAARPSRQRRRLERARRVVDAGVEDARVAAGLVAPQLGSFSSTDEAGHRAAARATRARSRARRSRRRRLRSPPSRPSIELGPRQHEDTVGLPVRVLSRRRQGDGSRAPEGRSRDLPVRAVGGVVPPRAHRGVEPPQGGADRSSRRQGRDRGVPSWRGGGHDVVARVDVPFACEPLVVGRDGPVRVVGAVEGGVKPNQPAPARVVMRRAPEVS